TGPYGPVRPRALAASARGPESFTSPRCSRAARRGDFLAQRDWFRGILRSGPHPTWGGSSTMRTSTFAAFTIAAVVGFSFAACNCGGGGGPDGGDDSGFNPDGGCINSGFGCSITTGSTACCNGAICDTGGTGTSGTCGAANC